MLLTRHANPEAEIENLFGLSQQIAINSCIEAEVLAWIEERISECGLKLGPIQILDQLRNSGPKSATRYSKDDQKKRMLDRAALILELELLCQNEYPSLIAEIVSFSSVILIRNPHTELLALCENLKSTNHLPCPKEMIRERLFRPLTKRLKPTSVEKRRHLKEKKEGTWVSVPVALSQKASLCGNTSLCTTLWPTEGKAPFVEFLHVLVEGLDSHRIRRQESGSAVRMPLTLLRHEVERHFRERGLQL